ncbi:MAG: hypothetical protein AABZ85_09495 [Thermodesulfobacteriota bacterium]
MDPKRGNRSRKKKGSVRFVIIGPKPSSRIKLSDRLFHPEPSGSVRSLRAQVLSPENGQPNLSFSQRLATILIAAIWLYAGLAIIVLGIRNGKWLVALLGLFAIWYGLGWFRVTYKGRLPGGRLRLNPWVRE